MKKNKGIFITFEGCEGVGKSTQAKMLGEYLKAKGYEIVFTREPGGTPVAEEVRKIILNPNLEVKPLTEAHLFVTARNDHIQNVILPSLAQGKIVLCDRYVDSSIAYQGVARALGIDEIISLNKYAFDNCMPDITVFIDMDPANSWRKQKGAVVDNDRLELENTEFHADCYKGFKILAKMFPERIVSITPEFNKEDTFKKILSILEDRI